MIAAEQVFHIVRWSVLRLPGSCRYADVITLASVIDDMMGMEK